MTEFSETDLDIAAEEFVTKLFSQSEIGGVVCISRPNPSGNGFQNYAATVKTDSLMSAEPGSWYA